MALSNTSLSCHVDEARLITVCLRINNPYDKPTWEKMAAIKTRILRIWDTAPPGIRICCIKFSQRVVLAQTAPPDGDARVSAHSDTYNSLGSFTDIILTAR